MSFRSCMHNPWFDVRTHHGSAELRLFLFPFAGGNGYPLSLWQNFLPPRLQLIGIQLPGRGRRLAERPFRRLEPLIAALRSAMVTSLDMPFALFGHSMGALIAFELCVQLEQLGYRAVHLFVSGSRAPHMNRNEKGRHNLPTPQFIEELKLINGTPAEILEDHAAIATYLPALRADFEVVETYARPPRPPLNCPITCIIGDADPLVTAEEARGWSTYTHGAFDLQTVSGDHFFVLKQERAVLDVIRSTLTPS